MRTANEISRYFYRIHPEHHTKVVNYYDLRDFDAYASNYSMDLYLLELNDCKESDTGFRIAKQLRDTQPDCYLTLIVPSDSIALAASREMLRPSYIFLKEAEPTEIHRFLDDLLKRTGSSAFMEFTYQYKKCLVNVHNIVYITTGGNGTLIVCTNEMMESTERLSELAQRLPSFFLRVDKGCLINTKHLVKAVLTERKAFFTDSQFVYMSRRGTKKLLDYISTPDDTEEEVYVH
jgi:DNA-binding LytR/AlgR family response regulator